MTKRAVIYCRVSTEEQKKSGTSLDKQEEACRKYAESHGFEVVGTFQDDYTGTTPIEQRPEGSKAYNMLTSGAADALIVFSIDRLVRPKEENDEFEMHSLIRGLAKTGREIHCADRGKIENNFVGILMAIVQAKVAGDERRTIIARMREGKRRKAVSLNKWVGSGFPPFGFTKVGKRKEAYLQINHREAQIVRRIFDLYLGLNGEIATGLDGIAKIFNAEGVPVTGRMPDNRKRPLDLRKWHASSLNKITRNRAYVGEFVWGSEVVSIPSLAIIPREVFEAAQAQRDINRRLAKRNTKNEFLLRGRLFCTCKRGMHALSYLNAGKMYQYYQCNRKASYDKTDCDCKKIIADMADRAVWNWLVDVFRNPDKLLAGLREYQARQKQKAEPNRARLAEIPGQIADCVRQARGLTQSLAAKDRDDPDQALAIKTLEDSLALVSTAHKHYLAEQEKITAEIEAAEVSEDYIEQMLAWAAEIRQALDVESISFEARRKLLDRLNVTAKIEYQNGERGLWVDCPVLSYAAKWQPLAQICEHTLSKECKQNMPQYSISGWVSLAEEFFSGAVKVAESVLE